MPMMRWGPGHGWPRLRRSLRDLGDLDGARLSVEEAKVTVEGARIAMMSARANHDELRREGEARLRRKQEATKELSGWRHRLETAEKRIPRTGDPPQ